MTQEPHVAAVVTDTSPDELTSAISAPSQPNNAKKGGRRRAFKIGAALLDQALFAGSNFVVNWLILLWLPKEEAGAVVVAFTWFLLLQTFYEALTVSPMSYYGAGKYSGEFRRYLAYIFFGHAGLALLVVIGLGAGAFLVGNGAQPGDSSAMLSAALAGAALASPFLLIRGLIRQPFYILSIPQWSAIGGAIYLITNILVTFLLYVTGNLTPFTALAGMGAAALITSIVQIGVLRPEFRKRKPESMVNSREVIADHWRQGKWSLSARGLSWVSTNSGYLLLPLVVGFSGSAALRASMNLVMPIFQANSALISLLTPTFVRIYNKEGKAGLNRRVWKISRMAALLTGVYFLFLTVFGETIIHLLYAGKYDADISVLFMMGIGILPVITTTSRILDSALVAMGRVKNSFQSKIIPTILTVVLDVLFVAAFGTIGIILESLITAFVTQAGLQMFYRRYDKNKAAKKSESSSESTPAEALTS
ncbi:MAG: hypothetical protein SF029_11525 [bacterium]|nr:hypothetical protein [bacterium]